jgi:hypothetical protein
MRIDVLPANISVSSDFEEAAKSTLAEESIAIGKSLRTSHEGSKEIVHLRTVAVLLNNLLRGSVNFNGA